jgi:hypothetical protein
MFEMRRPICTVVVDPMDDLRLWELRFAKRGRGGGRIDDAFELFELLEGVGENVVDGSVTVLGTLGFLGAKGSEKLIVDC